MNERAAEYARQMRELRRARETALAAWEALTTDEERIRGLEAERDDLIAEAEKAEAEREKFGPAYWNRRDAEKIQERIDAMRRPVCRACGQRSGDAGGGTTP